MSMTPALEGGDDDATKALKRASKPRTQLVPVRKYSAGDCFGASGALTRMGHRILARTWGIVRGDCAGGHSDRAQDYSRATRRAATQRSRSLS